MNTTQTAINAGLAGVVAAVARPEIVPTEGAAWVALMLVVLGIVGTTANIIGDLRPVTHNETHEQT